MLGVGRRRRWSEDQKLAILLKVGVGGAKCRGIEPLQQFEPQLSLERDLGGQIIEVRKCGPEAEDDDHEESPDVQKN